MANQDSSVFYYFCSNPMIIKFHNFYDILSFIISKKNWDNILSGLSSADCFNKSMHPCRIPEPVPILELTIFYDQEKRRFDQRTFNDEITAGIVLEKINAALPGGLTSIFTLVPPETGFTLKEISTSS
jgi:hypothetical protein